MKILLVYNAKGKLGDFIRINKIYEYLKKNHEIKKINLFKILKRDIKIFLAGLYLIKYRDVNTAKYNYFIDISSNFLKKIKKREDPDIIIGETSIIGAICTEIKEDTLLVTDVHGLKYAEDSENPFKKTSKSYIDFIYELEKKSFEESDYLLVVSNNMLEFIVKEFKIPKKKIVLVPNGSDIQEDTAKYDTPLKIIYGGGFNFWEDVDSFLDMAKRDVKNKYYLLGDGNLKKHILDRIRKEKININYIGKKNRIESLKIFKSMQVGVAPSSKGISRFVASPIKVFDYLACGLPVITPNCGEWAEEIRRYNAGIVTKESDAEEFLEALEMLCEEDIWQEKSENGKKLIKEKYSWGKILSTLDNLF